MAWILFLVFILAFVVSLGVLLFLIFKGQSQEARWLAGITDSLLLVNIGAIRAYLFPANQPKPTADLPNKPTDTLPN
jgi:hypothetical protein